MAAQKHGGRFGYRGIRDHAVSRATLTGQPCESLILGPSKGRLILSRLIVENYLLLIACDAFDSQGKPARVFRAGAVAGDLESD